MDEQLKQQLLPAVVVFNFTVIAYVMTVWLFFSTIPWYFSDFFYQALIGAGIGLVTGGITLGLMMMKK
jgi:hypothetical protein